MSGDAMVADLERLVRRESPSADRDALHRCADVVAEIGESRLGNGPTRTEAGGTPVLRFGPAKPAVLLLAHLDTVHPVGTLDRVPFVAEDGLARGPGIFDMKAGLVQAIHGLAAASDRSATSLLVNADEEVGSPASGPVIEATARRARAVFVLEPSSGGKLKTARKGISHYRIELTGRAAHAGLEPEKGANACVGLAHAILAASRAADAEAGTSVTPTVATAGTTSNTVPDSASLSIDTRAASVAEQRRVDEVMHQLTAAVDGVQLMVHGGVARPPLPDEASARLFGLAQGAAAELGLGPLAGEHVGGGSDGNLTAALGVETLDGLGAVGAGAHTDHEWVDLAAMPERTALLTRLIEIVTVEQLGRAR